MCSCGDYIIKNPVWTIYSSLNYYNRKFYEFWSIHQLHFFASFDFFTILILNKNIHEKKKKKLLKPTIGFFYNYNNLLKLLLHF